MRLLALTFALGMQVAVSGAMISFNNTGANGLYSTGIGSSNTLTPSGGVDEHYVLAARPEGCSGLACQESSSAFDLLGPSTYVVQGPNGTFPLQTGGWAANDGESQWIGPRPDQTNPVVGGTALPAVEVFASNTSPYVYRTVFSLSALGIIPSTASIQLAWASDDPSAGGLFSHIRMCGVNSLLDPACEPVSTIAGSTNSGPAGLTIVTINSGFTSGLMALDFVVYNAVATGGLNPSGLRVDILSAVGSNVPIEVGEVPEPGSMALLGIGLAALAAWRRRH